MTSILPRVPNFLDADEKISAVNARLAESARRDGFEFFNPHAAFTCGHRPTCELFVAASHNRHLTPAGYALLEQLFAPVLAKRATRAKGESAKEK